MQRQEALQPVVPAIKSGNAVGVSSPRMREMKGMQMKVMMVVRRKQVRGGR
jgi:hypothetical protein